MRNGHVLVTQVLISLHALHIFFNFSHKVCPGYGLNQIGKRKERVSRKPPWFSYWKSKRSSFFVLRHSQRHPYAYPYAIKKQKNRFNFCRQEQAYSTK